MSKIPQITAEIIDFDVLAAAGDREVIARYQLLSRMAVGELFQKKIHFNACQVAREEERLIVRLMRQPSQMSAPRLVAQCCFVRPAVQGGENKAR